MPGAINFEFPEPVPPASQLVALPFVGAVAGHLANAIGASRVRVTLHRAMDRDGQAYLQQLCAYATTEARLEHRLAGRIFATTAGIMGKAFHDRRVVRTRELPDDAAWWAAYEADRAELGEMGRDTDQPLSYLAVPMLDATSTRSVLILYAEVGGLNHFSKRERVADVVAMCGGLCRILDGLVETPMPRFRNYTLPRGVPYGESETVYPRLQESIPDPAPPLFERLVSFNLGPAP
ncbi:hypothetical protein [Methylobacterium sp. sgz302541]|uniref:hypothetical protein n=1 Tax=unclassified Methylobacterium TaxID=2615210 RepID=UPI003D35274B